MSVPSSARLDPIIERIEPAPPVPPGDLADGALGALAAWWHSRMAGPPPRPSPVTPHAASLRSVDDALAGGIDAADRVIDQGATLLTLHSTTPLESERSTLARGVISALARREASTVLPQPPGMDDRTWMRLCRSVRDHATTAARHRGDPAAILAAGRTAELAFWLGAMLAAAARRTPCLLDGIEPLASAVIGDRLAYQAHGWWLAATDSPDEGRMAAVDRAGLSIGLPLALADDRGLGSEAVLVVLDLLTRA